MSPNEEMATIAAELQQTARILSDQSFDEPLEKLLAAAEQIGKAWSGSWLGYHSKVYYEKLQPPPTGAYFTVEWGLMTSYTGSYSPGDWKEWPSEAVLAQIYEIAGNPNISTQQEKSKQAADQFDDAKATVLSLLHAISRNNAHDPFFAELLSTIQSIAIVTKSQVIELQRPTGDIFSRDNRAMQHGLCVPPHISVTATIVALRQPFQACTALSKAIQRAASYIRTLETHKPPTQRNGTHIFIGHGHSHVWKDLRDFIKERLKLPWDEFNRIPAAGVTNVKRLSQMLDNAAIAFLVMTGEDEQADGTQRARQNVIHEAGLFQGKLGFELAIVLLEEGCQDFSNIHGLGQIPFPKNNISAIFEEIRRVLEREGIIHEE